ncbi:MAG: hypothetical protein FWG12_06095 [Holophagaceae bacterium]|nr:hypothetical protein [Holophagaceae bacterium]
MGIVSYRADEIPPLSKEEKAHYRAMAEAQQAEIPNPNIDFSDIPPMTEEQLARMRPLREVMAERRTQQKTTV